MNAYRELFHTYTLRHAGEMTEMLKHLVTVRSDRTEALPGMPFGQYSAAVLREVHRLYTENGFDSEVHIPEGYALAEYGEGKTAIGLFAHADVVSAGNDWIFTDPWQPLEKEGILIGRGVLDDKAAVVISLWCARMFRDLRIPLRSKLVMFTGGCEETGMADLDNFVAAQPMPDFSLVCDTAFPPYIGDKGGVIPECASRQAFTCIRDFRGGKSANITLGETVAVLPRSAALQKELEAQLSERLTLECDPDELRLRAKGISTHGALPEGSLNAARLAACALVRCPSLPENDRDILRHLITVLEDCFGKPLGIDTADEHFGPLTCTNGVVNLEEGRLHFLLDIRHGDTVDQDAMLETLAKHLDSLGFDICGFRKRSAAWRLDERDPVVLRMLEVYRAYTGDMSPVRYNAGGTYARKLKNAVEVGTTTKWSAPFALPPGHGSAHQPDEKLSIEGFLEAFEIIASMILAADEQLQA